MIRKIILVALLTLGLAASAAGAHGPIAHASATCADFQNQLAAQLAADTRDADGDGIYCEDLPCPCSSEWYAQHGGGPTPTPVPAPPPVVPVVPPTPTPPTTPAPVVPDPTPTPDPTPDPDPSPSPTPPAPKCVATKKIVDVDLSEAHFPAVLGHMRRAIRAGWRRVLTLNRSGAAARSVRALRGVATRHGFERDQWPLPSGRATWRASVAYVPSGQERAAAAEIATKLHRYCDGVRFEVEGSLRLQAAG